MADPQLAVAHAGGEQRLDPRRDPGGLDDVLEPGQRDAHRCPPSSATASASLPGARVASRSPSRWLQVIPAACMNAARPEQVRAVSQPGGAQPAGVQPGQAGPAGQGAGQRGGHVAAGRVSPAGDQAGPGERRCGQQQLVVAGQHRHGPRPPPAHLHQDAAGPADDVAAAHLAQVGADQPGARAEADQPGRAHPPRCRRLGGGEREITVDLAPGYTAPWPAHGAAACPPARAAGPPARARNRRFVRSVRRVTPVSPGA